MSRASQRKALLLQHYYSPFRTTQLEKTTKNLNLGPFRAFWAKKGPFGALGRNKGAQYQVKVCGNHESNSVGPKGGSWDQIKLPGAFRGRPGPPKRPFWAKTGPFGGPRSAIGWSNMHRSMCYTPENLFRTTRGNLCQVGQFWPIRVILNCGPFLCVLEQFWGPGGYLNGPKVDQNVI